MGDIVLIDVETLIAERAEANVNPQQYRHDDPEVSEKFWDRAAMSIYDYTKGARDFVEIGKKMGVIEGLTEGIIHAPDPRLGRPGDYDYWRSQFIHRRDQLQAELKRLVGKGEGK